MEEIICSVRMNKFNALSVHFYRTSVSNEYSRIPFINLYSNCTHCIQVYNRHSQERNMIGIQQLKSMIDYYLHTARIKYSIDS